MTQSLALGLSAASIAADSFARIQRVVAPLPAGFPPGVVCMHGGHVLTDPWANGHLPCFYLSYEVTTKLSLTHKGELQAQAAKWLSTS